MTKYCPACKKDLKLSCFGKNKAKKDGLQNNCKACRSYRAKTKDAEKIKAYMASYWKENAEKLSWQAKEKYVSNPEYYKSKAREWRAANPERKKALDRLWQVNNKERANRNSREWARKNREKRRQILRRYNEANREKLRIKSTRYRARKQALLTVRYTEQQLLGKLIVWKYRCYLCNELLDDTLHWDHVKPLVAGGADMLCNLRPTHGLCNRRKSGKWPLERIWHE